MTHISSVKSPVDQDQQYLHHGGEHLAWEGGGGVFLCLLGLSNVACVSGVF